MPNVKTTGFFADWQLYLDAFLNDATATLTSSNATTLVYTNAAGDTVTLTGTFTIGSSFDGITGPISAISIVDFALGPIADIGDVTPAALPQDTFEALLGAAAGTQGLIDFFSLDASGTDYIHTGSSLVDTLTGFNGNDTMGGGFGDDFLFGGAGNDVLSGAGGNDTVEGGNGNDAVGGGIGND